MTRKEHCWRRRRRGKATNKTLYFGVSCCCLNSSSVMFVLLHCCGAGAWLTTALTGRQNDFSVNGAVTITVVTGNFAS